MASLPKSFSEEDDDPLLPPLVWVTKEEANRQFDELARERLGMSGAEFLRRYDSGEFDDIPDDLEHNAYTELAFLSSLGR